MFVEQDWVRTCWSWLVLVHELEFPMLIIKLCSECKFYTVTCFMCNPTFCCVNTQKFSPSAVCQVLRWKRIFIFVRREILLRAEVGKARLGKTCLRVFAKNEGLISLQWPYFVWKTLLRYCSTHNWKFLYKMYFAWNNVTRFYMCIVLWMYF